MPRILSIDYGRKRTGIAVTDEMKIIAYPLITISTAKLISFLKDYLVKNNVECIVIGQAEQSFSGTSHVEKNIRSLINKLSKIFPEVKIDRENEDLSSKQAIKEMIKANFKKKKRQKKENIDKISAALILQSYLEKMNN